MSREIGDFVNYNVFAEVTLLLVHLTRSRHFIGFLKIKEKQSAYGAVSRLFVEV